MLVLTFGLFTLRISPHFNLQTFVQLVSGRIEKEAPRPNIHFMYGIQSFIYLRDRVFGGCLIKFFYKSPKLFYFVTMNYYSMQCYVSNSLFQFPFMQNLNFKFRNIVRVLIHKFWQILNISFSIIHYISTYFHLY